ncbi:MAG TPA: plasmid pRiA4b ORF-3 family protein [Casimicrobiaceae bacterium]|jgi:hypothetical protein
MARRTHSDNEYRFKVNLRGAKRIWRLIVMRGDQTLDDLHEAIFGAFDRFDSHLYSFYFPKAPRRRSPAGPIPREYAAPLMVEAQDPFGTERRFNAARTRLDILGLQVGQQFEYLFDFGDSWWHEVTVEQIGPVISGRRYPEIVEKHGRSPAQYGHAEA